MEKLTFTPSWLEIWEFSLLWMVKFTISVLWLEICEYSLLYVEKLAFSLFFVENGNLVFNEKNDVKKSLFFHWQEIEILKPPIKLLLSRNIGIQAVGRGHPPPPLKNLQHPMIQKFRLQTPSRNTTSGFSWRKPKNFFQPLADYIFFHLLYFVPHGAPKNGHSFTWKPFNICRKAN